MKFIKIYLYFIPFLFKNVTGHGLSLKETNTLSLENDSIIKNEVRDKNLQDDTRTAPSSLLEEFGESLFPVRIMVTMDKKDSSFLQMGSTLRETAESSAVSKFEYLSHLGIYMIEMSENCSRDELNYIKRFIEELGGFVEFDLLAYPAAILDHTPLDNYDPSEHTKDSQKDLKYDPKQWYIRELNLDKVWSGLNALRNREVRVCVVDSGLDYHHDGFIDRLVRENLFKNYPNIKKSEETDSDNNGESHLDKSSKVPTLLAANFVDENFDPLDKHGHGTHLSGIISSNFSTSQVAGINPLSKIVSCKAFDSSVQIRLSNIVRCIDFCIFSNSEIQNHSWIVTQDVKFLRKAFHSAFKMDVIMVVAAGNLDTLKKFDSQKSTTNLKSQYNLNIDEVKQYPAVYSTIFPNVVTSANLMLLDKESTKSMVMNCIRNSMDYCKDFGHLALNENSMYGLRSVQIAAPGTNIFSLFPGNSYSFFTGTSASTAVISGVLSLIKSVYYKNSVFGTKTLTSLQSIQILRGSVKLIPNLRDKISWGGLPDCHFAVDLAINFLNALTRRPPKFKLRNYQVEV